VGFCWDSEFQTYTIYNQCSYRADIGVGRLRPSEFGQHHSCNPEWLSDRGYALHDICNFMRRPLDDALWQSDMIFVRNNSSLRDSKLWQKSV